MLEAVPTPSFIPKDWLDDVTVPLDVKAIAALRQERRPWLEDERNQSLIEAARAAPNLKTQHLILNQPFVTIGSPDDLSSEEKAALESTLKAFQPWKKGPYNLFGIGIDAEWRSDSKWARIEPHLAPLKGKTVADIGCHNGYFMFRMAAHQPRAVVGFEPVAMHAHTFNLLQKYARRPELHFELLGAEHMDLFPNVFDTVFCLGILYHHTDPIGLLRKIHSSLVTGGQLIVECQGIPGSEAIALTPRGRYAKARGVWFLPTAAALEHWLIRAGFLDVKCIYSAPLTTDEQRSTSWAPIDSLIDFLNPKDTTQTIEGYPAPYRHYFKARK